MILVWALLSFAMGLYMAFVFWVLMISSLGLLTVIPGIIVFITWLVVTIKFNAKFEMTPKKQ